MEPPCIWGRHFGVLKMHYNVHLDHLGSEQSFSSLLPVKNDWFKVIQCYHVILDKGLLHPGQTSTAMIVCMAEAKMFFSALPLTWSIGPIMEEM